MSHVVPFTISGFTFTHVEPGDARELETRRRYAELHDIATDSWRHEAYQPCAIQTEGERRRISSPSHIHHRFNSSIKKPMTRTKMSSPNLCWI